MAARTKALSWNQTWRQRINASMLVKRLQANALGEECMTMGQIKSAQILLAKVAPDLQQVSGTLVHAHTHAVRHIEITPVQALPQPQSPAIIEADYTVQVVDVVENNQGGEG